MRVDSQSSARWQRAFTIIYTGGVHLIKNVSTDNMVRGVQIKNVYPDIIKPLHPTGVKTTMAIKPNTKCSDSRRGGDGIFVALYT